MGRGRWTLGVGKGDLEGSRQNGGEKHEKTYSGTRRKAKGRWERKPESVSEKMDA